MWENSVFYHLTKMSYQHSIVCELSLADTANLSQQFFPADKAINSDYVI